MHMTRFANVTFMLTVALLFALPASRTVLGQTPPRWERITAGGEFSIAILSDGSLWGCGYNGNGQLGTGDKQQRNSFDRIGTETDWAAVEAGGFHTLALKSDGTLWSFGLNAAGQLGLGDNAEHLVPSQVGSDDDWVAVEAGYATSYAIKADGSMWAWGYNPYGQIGNGESGNRNTPVQVRGNQEWSQVSAGAVHVLAIDSRGHLYSWGGGPNGQLGQGDSVQFALVPRLVDSTRTWISVAAGFEFSVGVTDDGKLWTWGFNGNAQLGQGDYDERKRPHEVSTLQEPVARCFAGSAFGFAVTQSGELYAWGINIQGQLGFGDDAERRAPEKVPSSEPWSDIAAAEGIIANQVVFGHHTLALHESRQVICVSGANYVRQIGLPTDDASLVFNCSIGDLTLAVGDVPARPEQPRLVLYPNPARERFTLQLADDAPQFALRAEAVGMYDLLGRRRDVRVHAQDGILTVDAAGLPRGTYFLQAVMPDGTSRMHRVLLR